MAEIKHIGRKISKLRELHGWKQEALADALGTSQQAISRIEQSEEVDDATLDRIAKALGLSVESIKTYDDEKTLNFVQNNYEGSNPNASNVNANVPYNQGTINYADKLFQAMADKLFQSIEENKKLTEALLKEKDEKIALLQKMLDKK